MECEESSREVLGEEGVGEAGEELGVEPLVTGSSLEVSQNATKLVPDGHHMAII